MMKINVNASVSKNLKVASAVVVAHNSAGSFLGASAIVLERILDPETLEVLACREGLALASDLGLQRFRMASDCITAVRSMSLGSCGNVIKEIMFTLSTFVEVELVHEGRDANVDADQLAKSSTYSSLGRPCNFLIRWKAFVTLTLFNEWRWCV
jgi:ribonuclease HI